MSEYTATASLIFQEIIDYSVWMFATYFIKKMDVINKIRHYMVFRLG